VSTRIRAVAAALGALGALCLNSRIVFWSFLDRETVESWLRTVGQRMVYDPPGCADGAARSGSYFRI
jgi:hypothetical protein